MTRELERNAPPVATRYFTREELERTWAEIRPLDSRQALDDAMEKPLYAIVIKCAALAFRRRSQAIAWTGALQPPRDAEISQHLIARRLGRARKARPDFKQRAAHDVDLFEESTQ